MLRLLLMLLLGCGMRPSYGQIKPIPRLTGSNPGFHALLIAEQTYQHFGLLQRPIEHAENIEKILTNTYTFKEEHVRLIKDKSRDEILEALSVMANRLTDNDNLLVFFAGHGIILQADDNGPDESYLVPVEGDPRKGSTCISMADLDTIFIRCRARHILLITDACYSGNLVKRSAPKMSADVYMHYKNRSRELMASGFKEGVPDDSKFNTNLTYFLNNNDKPYLTSGDLFNKVKDPTIRSAPGTNPICVYIPGLGDGAGEFVFIKRALQENISGLDQGRLVHAKELALNGHYLDAKLEIDSLFQESRMQSNADAWYTRAVIYEGMANDAVLARQFPYARDTAFQFLRLYGQYDKDTSYLIRSDDCKIIKDIIRFYKEVGDNYFRYGVYDTAYKYYRVASAVTLYMSRMRWRVSWIDTALEMQSARAAELSADMREAFFCYERVADVLAKGAVFAEAYRWIVRYYLARPDRDNVLKYNGRLHFVYPNDSSYYQYEMQTMGKYNLALVRRYRDSITANPLIVGARLRYAELLYNFSTSESPVRKPMFMDQILVEALSLPIKAALVERDSVSIYELMEKICFVINIIFKNKQSTLLSRKEGLSEKDRAEYKYRIENQLASFYKFNDKLNWLKLSKKHRSIKDVKALEILYWELRTNYYSETENQDLLRHWNTFNAALN